mgnify:FL=1
MKVILTEGQLQFGMSELQTRYYITDQGQEIADVTVGVDSYKLNEHAAFADVEDKEALNRLVARAFVVLDAKFSIS